MSTIAYASMRALASDWEKKCGLVTAVMSGIVGDLAHAAKGGYHISRRDQPATNYSVIRPDDKLGPADAAAAIDMTMSSGDMQVCTARLAKAYSDASDPRRKYLNAFNGWDGSGDAIRYDIYGKRTERASADHKWHVHLEVRRAYVTSPTAMKAILSLLKGESAATYLISIGVRPAGAAPPYPGRTLRRNDTQKAPDAALRVWQQRVVADGWTSLGTPDGFFGAKTENIAKAIQKQFKLTADGVIGPKTWPLPWMKA